MLTVDSLYKTYAGRQLLEGISFSVSQGETICLLGPSGSGKSTLLRIIAGLEPAESGSILWNGQDMAPVPVHRRGFGLMFQDYALFPHRTVSENVAFGLRMQGLPRPEIDRRVEETLRQVNLAGFGSRRVTDLSGGEQQRVALGRAMAPRPRLLMLDEPLGALDRSLRAQLLAELRQVLRASAIPAIYVTHDQEEAFTIADRLILLHAGHLVQQGTPAEVHNRPATPWVAHFLGLGNLLAGVVASNQPLVVETTLGSFTPGAGPEPLPAPGAAVQILIRPENARLLKHPSPLPGLEGEGRGVGDTHPSTPERNRLAGIVQDVVFQGSFYRVKIQVATGEVLQFSLTDAPQAGSPIYLEIPPAEIWCFGTGNYDL